MNYIVFIAIVVTLPSSNRKVSILFQKHASCKDTKSGILNLRVSRFTGSFNGLPPGAI